MSPLALQGCDIQSLNRKRLRVKGKITNCQTGDRIIISKLLDKPIARSLQIGKYMAIVMHSGQPEFENRGSYSDGNTKPCYKCLQVGHFVYDCPNDWVCRKCKLPGHKMMDCPNAFQVVGNKEEQIVTTDESVTVDDSQSTEQAEKLNPKFSRVQDRNIQHYLSLASCRDAARNCRFAESVKHEGYGTLRHVVPAVCSAGPYGAHIEECAFEGLCYCLKTSKANPQHNPSSWVECILCGQWVHDICVHVKAQDIGEDDPFLCGCDRLTQTICSLER
ncbi:unnamed protein product [Mytilus edulis]|nr:unnamed protein product [Mytilus edulis]